MSSEEYRVVPELAQDLVKIGVEKGDLIVLHSSFRSLGRKDVSPGDLIRTFLEVLGEEGTLMTPTFTYSYSGIWNVRPFNPHTTPGVNNGIITETLRQYPGALRSAHPTYSVAAIGKHAEKITAGKDREGTSALGIGSSYDEAFQLGARILLLGVGNNRNSMVHYAEVVAGLPYGDIPFREFWGRTALVERDGQAVEVMLKREYPSCSANFGIADAYLAEKGIIHPGKILNADSMLMDARAMVEAMVERLKREPAWLLCSSISCEPCALRKRRLRELGLI